MKAWTIIGYAYTADIYCDGICILRALGEITQEQYDGAGSLIDATLPFESAVSVEEALTVIAKRRGIDKDSERSYDSGDFPKVIFASEEFPDYCPTCAVCHGVLDGFDADDYAASTDN